jgi:branched-chain amino acid transport system ATP-binding protein
VSVLDFGRTIATGAPEKVRSDPRVQAAYLGTVRPRNRAPVRLRERREAHAVRPLLSVDQLRISFGEALAVDGVSFAVGEGQAVALLGANGAGKSSLAAAIAGEVRPASGRVFFAGTEITGQPPHRSTRAGLTYVPEARGLFPNLSVVENLRSMLMWSVPKARRSDALERAFSMFPMLAQRRQQPAGTLSGGEQRMLTLARVVATAPRLVIADELSLGLAPQAVDTVFDAVERFRRDGVAVLLVEQYVERALELADAALIMRRGRIVWEGPATDAHGQLLTGYLGPEDADMAR